ncbi:MAG: glycosyltransferase [Turicibacter sp.]|nr:glycosyltransferase [Turicibacter sp.]
MELVSIIIPAYNCQSFIQNCLDSILSQTYTSIEIIIVNDGSTDNTLSILNQYAKKYPQMIKLYSVPNGGQGRARNFAVEKALGKYLLFVDSDDYLEPMMVETLVKEIECQNSTFAICAYSRVTKEGEFLFTEMNPKYKELINMNTSPWNKLFVRECFVKNKVRFSEGLWYEDLEAILKYFPHIKNPVWISQPLYHYVQHQNSSINQYDHRVEDIFIVMDNVYAYYEEFGYLNTYYDELEYFFIMHLIFGHLSRCVHEKDKSKRKALIKKTKHYLEKRFPKYYKNNYFTFSELKKNSLSMLGIKLIGINAFRFNCFHLILNIYDLKLSISPTIKRW